MAQLSIKWESVLGGWQPSSHFGTKSQFLSSLAIDPDMPVTDSGNRPSGLPRPTALAKISGSVVDAAPVWMVTNPKDSNAYWYSKDGKVGTIDTSDVVAALNSDTALTSATGNGAAYYDNYIYFAKDADICRYGPLNGSPAFTQNFWTSTLSLTAPTDTTYPSIRGIEMPNHPMHYNIGAQKLYFGDVKSTNQGILSFVSTTKTSVEGDTNDSSTYAALTFDYGQWPTCIESYGSNLAIGLINGVNTSTSQHRAIIAFWDRTSTDPAQLISRELPDPFITAMLNVNGILYVWTGSADGGTRVLAFSGGYSFREVAFIPGSTPPFAGAVDHQLDRIVWGGWTTEPESVACVWSLGGRNRDMGMGLHNILSSTSADTSQQNVTAVKYLRHEGQLTTPHVGWRDATSQGIDARTTTYATSSIRSPLYRIGQPFQIKRIRIPLAQAVTTNHTMTVKVMVDDASTTKTVATVNSTSKWAGKRYLDIDVTPDVAVNGENNVFIELRQTGTALLVPELPITIEGETKETNFNG